jgi:hypothetical protein
MVKIKEMPYSEKYYKTLDYMELLDTFVPPLVQKHLGNEKVTELQKIWLDGLTPVPADASFEEKYEIVYGDWVRKWSNAFKFVQTHLGEEGIEEFKYADVNALKKKSSGFALYLLKVVRAISPSLAFSMVAKQLSFQLQVFTPFSILEMNKQKAVFNAPRCKILDISNSEEFCCIGCQIISPLWLAEQFRVVMKTARQGNSCTITLTPIG